MSRPLLTINAGSSSVKFALFDATVPGEPRELARGEVARVADYEEALREVLAQAEGAVGGTPIVAAGHRVVHGGERFTAAVEVTPAVREALGELVVLAPLHQPHNLEGIDALARLHPALPQIACFDTAFHVTQPAVETRFAIPRVLAEWGVRRYGFHGLSYDYIASQLPSRFDGLPRERVVAAHLGSGASLCALRAGRSVATTMGFSALDGLPMSTRCGALDAGVLLYLLEQGMPVAELADTLWHRSGWLGVSGVSSDMQTLLASADPHAAEAVDLFVYRTVQAIGALAATLGGCDAIVFTGGIGEHSAEIRRRICARLGWLGVRLDARRNEAGGPRIDDETGAASAWALPTNEELTIARQSASLLFGSSGEGVTSPR